MPENEFKALDVHKLAVEALSGLPKKVGETARAFFLSSFIKEGFTDTSFIAWPKWRQ